MGITELASLERLGVAGICLVMAWVFLRYMHVTGAKREADLHKRIVTLESRLEAQAADSLQYERVQSQEKQQTITMLNTTMTGTTASITTLAEVLR